MTRARAYRLAILLSRLGPFGESAALRLLARMGY